MFDLRRRKKVSELLGICGVNGLKFPGESWHYITMALV